MLGSLGQSVPLHNPSFVACEVQFYFGLIYN